MASQADRRARREARRAEGGAIAAQPPKPPARPVARGGGDSHAEPHRRKRRFNFIRESWEELHKVEWPTQNQVIQGTIVVLVACIIVGFYLWGVDQAFRRLVQHVFIG